MTGTPRRWKSRGQTRPGFTLILVLVIVVGLALAAYTFADLMNSYREAAEIAKKQAQTELFTESGLDHVRSLIATSKTTSEPPSLYENPDLFRSVVVEMGTDLSGTGGFSILSPRISEDGELQGLRFGLEDESSRVNLLAIAEIEKKQPGVARPFLAKLPGMTDEIADAILDWLDDDTEPRELGAEYDSYVNANSLVEPRDGPIDTIEELLSVRGVTPDHMFGMDKNRNRAIEPAEAQVAIATQGQTFSVSSNTSDPNSANGYFETPPFGFGDFTTVWSRETNVTPDGQPRIYLNDPDLANLHERLLEVLPKDQADFLVLYRQFGPQGGASTAALGVGANQAGTGGQQGLQGGQRPQGARGQGQPNQNGGPNGLQGQPRPGGQNPQPQAINPQGFGQGGPPGAGAPPAPGFGGGFGGGGGGQGAGGGVAGAGGATGGAGPAGGFGAAPGGLGGAPGGLGGAPGGLGGAAPGGFGGGQGGGFANGPPQGFGGNGQQGGRGPGGQGPGQGGPGQGGARPTTGAGGIGGGALPSANSAAGGAFAGVPQPDLNRQPQTEFSQVLDVIGTTLNVQVGGQAYVVNSPFKNDPAEMANYLPTLMDATTVSPARSTPGRINVNQAPAAVLRAIPGVDDSLVEKILQSRMPETGADRNRAHETWLLTEGLVTLDQMRTLQPWLCGSGSVYRGQIVGFTFDGTAISRAEAVVEASTSGPRILMWRNLDQLGPGYSVDVLLGNPTTTPTR